MLKDLSSAPVFRFQIVTFPVPEDAKRSLLGLHSIEPTPSAIHHAGARFQAGVPNLDRAVPAAGSKAFVIGAPSDRSCGIAMSL